MGLRDCLVSAAEQGAITRAEASALADEFDARFAQARLSMGDDAARAFARKGMAEDFAKSAAEKRRRADLSEAARLRIKGFVLDEEGDPFQAAMGLLSHYGYRGASSARGRAEAVMATSHARISEAMFAFRRSGALGKRQNRAMIPDFIAERHGEASGDATAKRLAGVIGDEFETLRQRFNAAGGAIGKLENFGLPHSHDRAKIKAMGRAAWKDFIRPLIDAAKTIDPLTGAPVGARLDALLDHAYDNIVSEGRAHLTPSMRHSGKGAIASQRADERIFQFKDSAAWLEYHRRAGRGDVIQAVFNHINGMARDIGMMETFGPNPAAMLEYVKQLVSREIGRKEAGLPSLAADSRLDDSQAGWAGERLDALYQALRGTPTIVAGAANFTSNVKNVLTSAQLGATVVLAAATDPFISASARRLAGLPVTSTIGAMLANLKKSNRDAIVRSGVVWDEYLHVMGDELRFAGPVLGSDWSRWLADRSVTWSGLKPLTTGRKLVEARAWQEHFADLAKAKTDFGKLDPRLKNMLEGFGIDRSHWDIWRQSVDANGFVTPMEILRRGGAVTYLDRRGLGTADPALIAEEKALVWREAAEKLAEMTTSWSERSVPQGTPNARTIITSKVPRGTVPGEVIDYMLQYKSFGLSFTSLQLEAIAEVSGKKSGLRGMATRSGMAYFAALAVPLTLAGGAYLQIKGLLDGKDPEPVTEPGFWLRSALTGGGFGVFGDFVKAGENRFGQSPMESLAGPGLNFLGDAWQLTAGNVMQGMRGEAMQPGRDFTKFLGRYTPVLSSHWATRGAYRRVFLDNLQWLADPDADRSFKAQAAIAKKNRAPFFVPPGALTPSRKAGPVRAPDFTNVISP